MLRVLIVVLVTGLLTQQALAQGKTFDEAYNKGQDLYNLGKYDEAYASFEKARDIDPSKPGPHRWLGRTARAMEKWKDCITSSTQAMRLNPTSQYAADMKKDIDVCRAALGYPSYPGDIPAGQGALAVVANVEGAAVTVDELKKGATPLAPIPLLPGKHKVHVERKGYLPVDVAVELVVGIVVDVDVELAADPDAQIDDRLPDQPAGDVKEGWLMLTLKTPGATVTLDGKPAVTGDDGTITSEPGIHVLEVTAPGFEPYRRRVVVVRGQKRAVAVVLKRTDDRKRERTIGYVMFGTSMAAFGAGLVFGYLESEAIDEAHDIRAVMDAPAGFTPPPGSEEAELLMKDLADVESQGDTYGLISKISIGVGAVALGVSIYYLVSERSDDVAGTEPPMAKVPALTPTVGPNSVGLVWTKELSW